jgi:hypothetical protein
MDNFWRRHDKAARHAGKKVLWIDSRRVSILRIWSTWARKEAMGTGKARLSPPNIIWKTPFLNQWTIPFNKTTHDQFLDLGFSLQSLCTKPPTPAIVECLFRSLVHKHERSDILEIQRRSSANSRVEEEAPDGLVSGIRYICETDEWFILLGL